MTQWYNNKLICIIETEFIQNLDIFRRGSEKSWLYQLNEYIRRDAWFVIGLSNVTNPFDQIMNFESTFWLRFLPLETAVQPAVKYKRKLMHQLCKPGPIAGT